MEEKLIGEGGVTRDRKQNPLRKYEESIQRYGTIMINSSIVMKFYDKIMFFYEGDFKGQDSAKNDGDRKFMLGFLGDSSSRGIRNLQLMIKGYRQNTPSEFLEIVEPQLSFLEKACRKCLLFRKFD